MSEIWLPIPGWEESHEVSNAGRVRTKDRIVWNGARWKGRILRPATNRHGHQRVRLIWHGRDEQYYVHALMMLAFVGERPTPEHDIWHIDLNRSNNVLSNLRYCTKRERMLEVVKSGNNHQSNKTHCPRGHELADWNNVTWYADRGRRTCKSCGNARTYARNTNTAFDPAIADDYYAKHKLSKELVS